MSNPLTPAMVKYREIEQEFKRIEKEKKSQRDLILLEFKANPFEDFEGINWAVQTRTDFKHKEFYDWVARTWPDKLEGLRAHAIDYEKFELAFAKGEIEYDELPPEVFSSKDIDVVKVTR